MKMNKRVIAALGVFAATGVALVMGVDVAAANNGYACSECLASYGPDSDNPNPIALTICYYMAGGCP